MPQSKIKWVRRSARVIRMVGELHRMGLQRLRIMPFQYGLGTYRVLISTADRFSATNGAYSEFGYDTAHAAYSSADEDRYFGWKDAAGHNARQLADKFVERFPELCERGSGRDWAYAGWFAELEWMLETFPSRLPVVMAEDIDVPPESMGWILLRLYGERTVNDGGEEKLISLPPSPL